MTLKLHASGLYDYLEALKEAYRNLISLGQNDRSLPTSKKIAEIDRLKLEYDKKRKLARYGLY